ncbi:unnamed protein product [Polarella glacialis]|uniref:Glycosyltransferase 2-like domain-containing protein n=2 Tax=Polarella glacialis TaxID=89957 RepID=A0A813GIM6_POLGL|nr:unnamed protein product [Polarella glacialis]
MASALKAIFRLAVLAELIFQEAHVAGAASPVRALYDAHMAELKGAHARLEKECTEDPQDCGEDHREIWSKLAFRKALSDRIPLARTVPDTRPASCRKEKPKPVSGKVSVILVYHHEAASTLLRTAQSILDRTVPETLEEILLVRDGPPDMSWAAELQSAVDAFVAQHPQVRQIFLPEHQGLAPAKVAGAKEAKGDLLVFLDSHCEVNQGWLEPLAEAVAADPKAVAVPVIDGISATDFTYAPQGVAVRGVMTWGLYYAGEPFSPQEQKDLGKGKRVGMPIMPGGLFLISRSFFEELGYYDEGLRIWGAENIELSLKVWRCGGRVELVPCSKIGHVFKAVEHRFPSGESLHKNFKRIAELWLDEYKEFYMDSFPMARGIDSGDLTLARQNRDRLKCESMDWFIQKVYPSMFVPKPIRKKGLFKSQGGYGCLDMHMIALASNPRQNPHVSPAGLQPCAVWSDYNQWYLMKNTRRLVHIGIWTEECLGVKEPRDANQENAEVVVCQCAKYAGSGCSEREIEWKWIEKLGMLKHESSGRCLTTTGMQGRLAAALSCDRSPEERRNKWAFEDRHGAPMASHDEL